MAWPGHGGGAGYRAEGLEPRHLGRAPHGEPAAQAVALACPVAVHRGQAPPAPGRRGRSTMPRGRSRSRRGGPRGRARPGPGCSAHRRRAGRDWQRWPRGTGVPAGAWLPGLPARRRPGERARPRRRRSARGPAPDRAGEPRLRRAWRSRFPGPWPGPALPARTGPRCRPNSVDRACSLPSAASVHQLGTAVAERCDRPHRRPDVSQTAWPMCSSAMLARTGRSPRGSPMRWRPGGGRCGGIARSCRARISPS